MNFEKIIQELIDKNWSMNENFLDQEECLKLISEFKTVPLKNAQVGSGTQRVLNQEIRSDNIYWLEEPNISVSQRQYLDQAEELKSVINRELFLGLKEFECHLAYYKIGSHYKKHTDQFKGNNSRTVTLITYLNTPIDGGELVIYKKENNEEIEAIVKPKEGLMICFLSDQLYHEVLPTKDDRYSITGWFKNKI